MHHLTSFILYARPIRFITPFQATSPVKPPKMSSEDPETPHSAHTRLTHTFSTHLTHPLIFRRTQLKALRQHLHTHEDSHLQALKADLHKPAPEALVYDLSPIFSDIHHLLRLLPKLVKPKLASRELGPPVYTERHPKGVVLIIGPFNFPTQLVIRPMVAAIAAGNCVVIKPSENTPASGKFLSGLSEALDKRIFACVTGGVEVSKELLELKWDHIMFTGSARVGKIVMSAAAKHLTPVTLELGGKNPAVITESAHLETAAGSVVRARYTNCGQICLAGDYCLVHEKVYEEFKKRVLEKIKLFYGDSPKSSPVYARLVSSQHLKHVHALLEGSTGNVLTGGEVDDSADHYVAPTVVEVEQGDALLSEEIFGPILPLLKVRSVDEAVSYINARDTPLALYLFCTDKFVTKSVIDRTRSGGVGVNETVFQIEGKGSFLGGFGESGMGAYGMEKGFESFSHERPVLYSNPFFAKIFKSLQPHRMITDGKENERFDKLVRLVKQIPDKGGDSIPVDEKFLGGVRRVGALIVAFVRFLFGKRSKSRS